MRSLLSSASFEDSRWFRFGDATLSPGEVWTRLRPHLTVARVARIERAIAMRTDSLAVVMEGVADSGNVAAVMRTAEAFGVLRFHIIDTAGNYKHSRRTTQGAERWLDRRQWRDPSECVAALRDEGRRIVAAHPSARAVDLDSVDFSRRTALVFGNERVGLSDEVLERADDVVVIPMSGFSRSLNVSVAAGIALHAARARHLGRAGSGDLSSTDRSRVRAIYAMLSVEHHQLILERSLVDQPPAATTRPVGSAHQAEGQTSPSSDSIES